MSHARFLLGIVNNRSRRQVPVRIRRQVAATTAAFRRVLGNNLVGLYVHGSLATGGFDPRRSDIDLLALTRRRLTNAVKKEMIEAFLRLSGNPRPIEMSIVARADVVPWRHPAPFQLCWSEDWRAHYRKQIADGTWKRWHLDRSRDGDLAAHVAMTRARGVTLYGPRADAAFPFVPIRDLVASLVSDGRWALRRLRKDAGMSRYAVLNACRRLALLRHGLLLSKAEGAAWAMSELGSTWRGVIVAAWRGGPHRRPGAFLKFMATRERSALAR